MTVMGSEDWQKVDDAAASIGKKRRQVYHYLALPESETGINRRRINRTTYVHMPSLVDYEATVKIGRPRKT